ncbi:cellulase family glycosylhydrolase [Colwellia sp. E2M01]|uniref:cellulase family glycosylhydrolase n=1 Tax=Colwellia sp. E2M01 TaxID=2841561 RepID=UPI001C0860B7|nr:cellulase family glycosylhydrolase [Colwellia sp. E2M01]MBU2870410.1 cellulase family glycosylhydrolase [Colwellia sp. E2M01]
MINNIKKTSVSTIAAALILSTSANAGFYVSSGNLYEDNGNKFVMRGINHAHTWFANKLDQSLQDIASTGSNTVRVVLSNGHKWNQTSASDVANIIQKAKDNKMIVVLEVHDTTGYQEDGTAASLSSAVDYWLTIKNTLIGQEDYVIVNIGNEPFGNGFNHNDWISHHETAIQRLRTAGLTHTLMVDAPNWGQDWQHVMRDNANTVFNSDPDKNIIFSVHMYEVFNSRQTISDYMTSFSNKGLPLVIGEFAASHKEFDVDEESIMSLAVNNDVGYLGWSWDGNDSSYGSIDIVNNWNTNSLTAWGDILINSANGIKATSQIATIYTGESNSNNGNSTDDIIACTNASSDPDGDGWGWENNQSCKMEDSVEIPDDSITDDIIACTSASSDPDGDGWGWENNQSCKVEASSLTYINGFPVCSFDSDSDGDGWGWENSKSCIIQY